MFLNILCGFFQADKEATELRSELQLLEKQSVLSYECAEYVNEAFNSFLMHALAFNSFLMYALVKLRNFQFIACCNGK
ncbi:hypothetical protein Sjap_018072 [Stephania japonica]|uniref:Uncharacterized protein n=1 Tax=Stephania japonica TaxID=461633 RepID=A0AAP0I7A6_9MAGN